MKKNNSCLIKNVFKAKVALVMLFVSLSVFSQDWTWVKGAATVNQFGNYGTQGVASISNVPGARYNSVCWQDTSNNLWLYGGYGSNENNINMLLSDMWKYNTITNNWTWVSGNKTGNQAVVYGTLGVSSSSNTPGGRIGAVSWIDKSGMFWLYGGGDSNDYYSDALWKYNINTNEWTWMNGGTVINQAPIYGTQGVGSSSNSPGSRYGATSWIDSVGNLWLFGGNGSTGYYNDLWKYSIVNNQWTWLSGNNIPDQLGSYSVQGVSSLTNVPAARCSAMGWVDTLGNFWLFGGAGNAGYYNDLLKYNILTNQWTWMKGSSTVGYHGGNYGSHGVSAPTNTPGARDMCASWIDTLGNFWLYGGWGNSNNHGQLNDLWKYDGILNEWTWIDGSNLVYQIANYGTQGVPSSANNPGARSYPLSWTDSNGDFWMFGGETTVSSQPQLFLNDLWKFSTNSLVGLKENTNRVNVSVYPNPFSYSTTIQLNSKFENSFLTIYNLFGQEVKKVNVESDIIVFKREELSDGVYFYLVSDSNNIFFAGKLVIED